MTNPIILKLFHSAEAQIRFNFHFLFIPFLYSPKTDYKEQNNPKEDP